MRAHIGGFSIFLFSAMGAGAAETPAEMPPEGYSERAFVDSTGCAFTRAEMNDVVVWVPRLDATRVPVCDEVPTLAHSEDALVVTSPVSVSVAPRPVRKAKPPAPVVGKAPTGFKRAWNDGRLNPNRGPQTAAGDAAMARVWSNDVPMKRIKN